MNHLFPISEGYRDPDSESGEWDGAYVYTKAWFAKEGTATHFKNNADFSTIVGIEHHQQTVLKLIGKGWQPMNKEDILLMTAPLGPRKLK